MGLCEIARALDEYNQLFDAMGEGADATAHPLWCEYENLLGVAFMATEHIFKEV